MNTLDLPVSLTIDGHEAEWEAVVTYEYHPPIRGYRGRYGEQMEPDEDAHCEIVSVTATRLRYDDATKRHVSDGEPVKMMPLLSRSQVEALEETALRDHDERRQSVREAADA